MGFGLLRVLVRSTLPRNRIVIFGGGDRTFVELGGAPRDVKIARNMVVVANQAIERVQLVRLDGTFIRRILLRADPHDLAIAHSSGTRG